MTQDFNHSIAMGGVTVEVIINDIACISQELLQYRYPKTKKARIRKKWAKNKNNYRLQDVHKAITIGRTVLVSTKIFEKIKKYVDRTKNNTAPNGCIGASIQQ